MATTPKPPIEPWLEDNLPDGATCYRVNELSPNLKADWAARTAENFAHETDPGMLAAAADFLRQLGVRGH